MPVSVDDPSLDVTGPEVAAGPGGTAVVVWRITEGAPAQGRIVARRSVGAGWGDPVTVSGGDDASSPGVEAGPAGEAIVVWQTPDPSDPILRIRARRHSGVAWRDQIDAVSPDGQDAAAPDVAMSSDGTATVGWQWRTSGGQYFAVASRLVGDNWSRSPELSAGADGLQSVVTATAPGGAVAAAWLREPESGPLVAEVARFDGQSWQPAAGPLADPALEVYDRVIDVAVGPHAVATVAWVLVGGPKNLAQARRVGPDGPGVVHNLAPGLDSEDIRVAAAAPDGVVTAVWRSDVGSEYRTKASLFRVPPPAPTGVGAVAGDAQATVSWSAPALTGGSPVTGYRVTATPGGRTCDTAGALSCTVDGLTNGTPHTFNVRAINARGTGPASAESPPVTPMAAVVPDPGPAPVTPVPVAPLPALSLTGVAVAPRVAVRGRPAQTTRTLTIRATLNRQARLRVLFQRQAPGLRRGRACVAPTAALRRAKARPCARFLTAGSLTRPGRVGVNRITVTRLRVGSRVLAPGRYRVSVIAAVAGSPTRVAQRPPVVRAAR